MKIFVGLGNPGEQYDKTPHNAGFMFVDKLRHSLGYSSAYNVNDWDFDKYSQGSLSIGRAENEMKFVLAKPLTFMNRSGRTVSELMHRYKFSPESDLVVIYDDLDLKLGDFKIVKGKFPKGHKGVNSVFNAIKEYNFLNVRLGVDNRDNSNIPGDDYVLREYSSDELEILDKTILEAIKRLRLSIGV